MAADPADVGSSDVKAGIGCGLCMEVVTIREAHGRYGKHAAGHRSHAIPSNKERAVDLRQARHQPPEVLKESLGRGDLVPGHTTGSVVNLIESQFLSFHDLESVLVQHVHGLPGLHSRGVDQVLTVNHGSQDQDSERSQDRGSQQISERSLYGTCEYPDHRHERHPRVLCKLGQERMANAALQIRASDQVSITQWQMPFSSLFSLLYHTMYLPIPKEALSSPTIRVSQILYQSFVGSKVIRRSRFLISIPSNTRANKF